MKCVECIPIVSDCLRCKLSKSNPTQSETKKQPLIVPSAKVLAEAKARHLERVAKTKLLRSELKYSSG